MKLFDNTALFGEGEKRFIDFKLPDTQLCLWEQFFSKDASDAYYQILKNSTPWKQHLRKIYDKVVPDPELTAYYGGENGLEWTDCLPGIKRMVENECWIVFNRGLLGRKSICR
jgi:hypothetical protein